MARAEREAAALAAASRLGRLRAGCAAREIADRFEVGGRLGAAEEGKPADCVVFDAPSATELLRLHPARRWVVGRVIAETEPARTTLLGETVTFRPERAASADAYKPANAYPWWCRCGWSRSSCSRASPIFSTTRKSPRVSMIRSISGSSCPGSTTKR